MHFANPPSFTCRVEVAGWIKSYICPTVVCAMMFAMRCAFPPHMITLFQCDGVFGNLMEIKEINVEMTYNSVHAKDTTCIQLNLLVLQTSTNMYTLSLLLD